MLLSLDGDEYIINLHEVYYDDNNVIRGFKPTLVFGNSIRDTKWTIRNLLEATKKPLLWGDSKFPKEVIVKYKCTKCGRDTFDKPSPHNCIGGFRKRKLTFETLYL